VGTNAAQTIALPDTSLNGIAQAINAANVGATASVINDGTGYRLMLTANETGTDNAINEVTATDANPTSSTALSTLFSGSQAEATSGVGVGVGTGGGMLTIFAAQNAKLTMGGVESQLGTIVEQSNSVNNLIPGVNLSLYNTGAATISVANNPTGVVQAITTMVNDVNSALTYFTQNGSYDTTTNTAGALFNDDPIRDGLNSLITTLTGSVAGLPSSMNSLGALGITVDQQTGLLDINQTALTAAVTQDPQGVANIFTNTSTSTSSGVQFAALTGNLDTSQPFNVDVTTAATQAIVTGSQPITGNVTIGSGDNTLSLNVNGQIVSASIATGTYTAASLVTAMQSAITQAAPAGSNLGVQMSVNTSGAIQINTTGFGSSQSVDVLTAPSALGMPTGSATGTDVQGTINGIAAQGQGQVLTGLAGTPVAGLVLSVTAQVPENDVTVNISQGLAQQASNQLTNLTDSQTGSLVTEEQSLNSQVSDYATQITQFNAKLSTQETLYQEQFTEMETLIQSANSQGSFLTQFVAQMDNTSSSSSSGSG
jgi:flagellar hook-associated protein 2